MLEKEVRFGGRDMWKIFRDENFQNNLLAGVLGGFISGMFLLLGIFITDILNQNKNILIIGSIGFFAVLFTILLLAMINSKNKNL